MKKCECTFATAANTPSVAKGFEVGGYLLTECPACTSGESDALDFDSDEPLACPMRDQSGDTTCESCQ